MTTKEKLLERLGELVQMGDHILQSSRPPPPNVLADNWVDEQLFHEWKAGSLSFLTTVFGDGHPHTQLYRENVRHARQGDATQGQGVLRAAKADLEGGYLISLEDLVAADIFTDLLDMADHLLEQGYHLPAASLTGAVLEDGLRKLCEREGVHVRPKSDDLNSLTQKLVDKGVFSRLTQKRVNVWADVRNNADHGHFEDVTKKDVREMLTGVQSLLGEKL